MNDSSHFHINYRLRGEAKSFYLRSSKMSNAHAWHMAAVDAELLSHCTKNWQNLASKFKLCCQVLQLQISGRLGGCLLRT